MAVLLCSTTIIGARMVLKTENRDSGSCPDLHTKFARTMPEEPLDTTVGRRYKTSMFRRFLCIAISFWALQILPLLCLAGAVSHPCDRLDDNPRGMRCHSEQQRAGVDRITGLCTHENGCEADPCHEGSIIKEGSDHSSGPDELHPCMQLSAALHTLQVRRWSPLPGENLSECSPPSLHSSDIPLRL